ncbi:MAG TPA: hypothetical protein VFJ06_11000 [Halococcus sp.]|nr:hypothetical protein [Halococcus sp.]
MSSSAVGTTNTRAFVEALSYENTPLDRTPARDDAVLAAYKHLITYRAVSRLGLVANVYPQRDGGLGSKEWYTMLISPLLRDLPGVSPPGPGTALWRYVPE